MRSTPTHLVLKTLLDTLRASAAAAGAIRERAVIAAGRDPIDSPPAANRHRNALGDAISRPLARSLSGVVAVIGREVAADHERLLGGAISRQVFRLVWNVCTVFSIVDDDLAEEAVAFVEGLVEGLGP